MYEIKRSKKFKTSYKRVSGTKRFPEDDLDTVVILLESGTALPSFFMDHPLKGNYTGMRECHLAPDCLLIYEIDHVNKTVRFIDIGNHANLFE